MNGSSSRIERHFGRGFVSLASLLILVIPLAVAGDDKPHTADRWLRELSSKDATQRYAAIRALGAEGAAVAPRLSRLIRSTDDDRTRLAALEALSLSETAYAYNYIFWDQLPPADTENKEAANERRITWNCLIRAGDAFLGVGEYGAASDHYCDLLESAEDQRERATAILGLGRASRRRAAEEVFAAIDDKNPVIKRAVLAAITKLRWGQALPHLRQALEGASPERIAELLDALSRRNDAGAVEMVAGFIEHSHPKVQIAARRARARHLGYLTEWWIPESIAAGAPHPTVPDVLKATEEKLILKLMLDGEKQIAAKFGWRQQRTGSADGKLDLSEGKSEPSDASIAYTEFLAPRPVRASLRIHAKGAISCWIDGKALADSSVLVDAGRVMLELDAGLHRVVLRIACKNNDCSVALRLTDASEKPLLFAPRIHGLPGVDLQDSRPAKTAKKAKN